MTRPAPPAGGRDQGAHQRPTDGRGRVDQGAQHGSGAVGGGLGYTDMLVSAHDLVVVLQDDTPVDPAHRGRRLGALLELADLRLLHAHTDDLLGPRRLVQTFTVQGNTPMQRTNDLFGFRAVDALHEREGFLRPT